MPATLERPIYDRHGVPHAYLATDGVIYRFDGVAVAYIHRVGVWTFSGLPTGWFSDGWLRSLAGTCAGFTANASSSLGPPKATNLKRCPQMLARRALHGLGVRGALPVRPAFKTRWCKAPLRLYLAWMQYDAGQ